MKNRIEIYSIIAGIVFMTSGMAKSLNISAFSDLIKQYGFGSLQFVTPVIALAEFFLGLLLVFNIKQKHSALACGILTAVFTLVYSYGVVFRNIEDCGCFGEITVLNTSYPFTLIRNAVLMYLLFVVWQKGANSSIRNKWVERFILAVMCIAAFISGSTYRHAGKALNAGRDQYGALAKKNTILKEFVSTSKDSTYLVFAFTYLCPHCMNSIENLNRYESSGTVDKVIGIALEDSIAEYRFKEIFKPEFSIRNYPAGTLFRLTNSFPVAYYIKNDSIMAELSGELPCSYVFTQKMAELTKSRK
jgi:uncharacterized membrane protein YphA (DoxX/SURF4 family)